MIQSANFRFLAENIGSLVMWVSIVWLAAVLAVPYSILPVAVAAAVSIAIGWTMFVKLGRTRHAGAASP